MSNPDRFSELRVLRWFDRIDEILSGEVRGPVRANVDLTNVCQQACPWCEPLKYREDTLLNHEGTLKTEVALEVLEDLASLDTKTINFSGGGEPLLHPCFGPILKRAVDLHMKTWIVTNGASIHKWFDFLLLADHVRISLDASLPEEYQAMHGRGWREFEKVKENIRELCKRRARGDDRVVGSPEVGIAYICADVNDSASSLEAVLSFASEVGVNFVHFRPLSEEKPDWFNSDWKVLAEVIENLALQYPSVQVFPLAKRHKDVFLQRDFESCYAALTLAVIGADGNVVACCDERRKIFGNVNQQSFKSIWLSAKHREEADGIVPKLCQRCLMCGYNRAVQKYVLENAALPELL
jgi:MoaA/NifB/PqqE/SkfB family radical SAM enzyme